MNVESYPVIRRRVLTPSLSCARRVCVLLVVGMLVTLSVPASALAAGQPAAPAPVAQHAGGEASLILPDLGHGELPGGRTAGRC